MAVKSVTLEYDEAGKAFGLCSKCRGRSIPGTKDEAETWKERHLKVKC